MWATNTLCFNCLFHKVPQLYRSVKLNHWSAPLSFPDILTRHSSKITRATKNINSSSTVFDCPSESWQWASMHDIRTQSSFILLLFTAVHFLPSHVRMSGVRNALPVQHDLWLNKTEEWGGCLRTPARERSNQAKWKQLWACTWLSAPLIQCSYTCYPFRTRQQILHREHRPSKSVTSKAIYLKDNKNIDPGQDDSSDGHLCLHADVERLVGHG